MSKCILCIHCRTKPAEYKDSVWCQEKIFLGLIPLSHPFLRTERACEDFELEGEETK